MPHTSLSVRFVRFLVLTTIAAAGIGSAAPAMAQFGGGPARHIHYSAAIAPGTDSQPAHLIVTGTADEKWNTYSLTQPTGGPQRTKIKLADGQSVALAGPFAPNVAFKRNSYEKIWPGVPIQERVGTWQWVAPLSVPDGTELTSVTVTGVIRGQECEKGSCIQYKNTFEAQLDPNLAIPATIAVDAPSHTASRGPGAIGIWTALGLAFIGGIVLNVMPCVLPVIGLKVLAFIEQGGQSRSKVFFLNFWYSAGVIAVWLVLAALGVIFQLGLGELFQSPEFSIVMAAVIFVMGLSFLGIWEIPIPGFIGTQDVTKFGEREGYEGAFAKGTITTLLATPCLGPFMGGLFIGLLARPSTEIFAIFFAIGLGMASPYLILGLLPNATRFLPKPGAWMNTFKEVMGFLLLGTTVYLLTVLKLHMVVPVMILLIGLGAVCWWIGRVPPTADPSRRWRALGESILVGTLIGLFAFYVIAPEMETRVTFNHQKFFDTEIERMVADGELELVGELPVFQRAWQPYTEYKFDWLTKHNKPFLIDFTADWCPTCKLNEKTVLKTKATTKFLEELGVYTLVADWTHDDEAVEVTKKLEELGVEAIPLVAIYRPGDPKNPILIPGTLTSDDLRADIRRALGADVAEAAAKSSKR